MNYLNPPPTFLADELPLCPPPVDAPRPSTATAVDATIARIERTLDEAQQLLDLVHTSEPYDVAPLGYDVPPGFKLSIVMPVYNEERTIHEILARVAAIPLPKEIIVVDDCSRDRTRDMLAALSSADELRVIAKPQNEGKGAALRTGFQAATGDVVIVQDADLEYDPRDIPAVVRPIVENKADVVFGSRFLWEEPQDQSFVHRLGNWALTTASNLTTGLWVTDMETCYKAFRREIIQGVDLQQNRFGFEPEVTAKIARRGCRVTEVPIRYNPRSYAEGKKIGVKDLFNALWCIARYGLWR
jgi:glycosyltransferase involved in cell wall biosynthesis